MTDLLIRNVDPESVLRIERQATRQGLSREEYLRRELTRFGRSEERHTTLDDLDRFSEMCADLADESVMTEAWS